MIKSLQMSIQVWPFKFGFMKSVIQNTTLSKFPA
jgi:hypothetical protein